MDYYERHCKLCGVTFAIARSRTTDECYYEGWDNTGNGHFKSPLCDPGSGCHLVSHRDDSSDQVGEDREHVSGPGCTSTDGYAGGRISTLEMEGCRESRCLLRKIIVGEWVVADDDEDFEIGSAYFLSAVEDGAPDEGGMDRMGPPRHGIAVLHSGNPLFPGLSNLNPGGSIVVNDERALVFHPTCFTIFKRLSLDRFGKVDAHGLWSLWQSVEENSGDYSDHFPYDVVVRTCSYRWWCHEVGSEYLAANPVHVPGLSSLVKTCELTGDEHRSFDVNGSVFGRPSLTGTTDSELATSDIFQKLPTELRYQIITDMSSRDIANLRLATRAYRMLPCIMWREFLLKEMPWFYEARLLAIATTDWFQLYLKVKFIWVEIKGLKNRKRIWKGLAETVKKIEMHRNEGKIRDEDECPIVIQ